ncbi:hypothetical protein [Roseivivax sp. CAU 1761]
MPKPALPRPFPPMRGGFVTDREAYAGSALSLLAALFAARRAGSERPC